MRERLQDYVYGDPGARRLGDRLSLLIAFAWYLISSLFHLHGPLIQSVAILIFSQLLMTLQYCLRRDATQQRSPESQNPFTPRRTMLLPVVRFATIALIAIFGGPAMEAALINDRLRRLSSNPNVKGMGTAAHLISAATSERILLSVAPIERIVARRLLLEDVLHAVLNRVNREAESRNLPTPVFGMLVWATKGNQGSIDFFGIAPQSAHVRPGLVPPDMVAFAVPIGKDHLPTLPGVGYVRIKGDEARIDIHLDRLHCKNVIFSDCNLIYSGGAIQLENTGFYNCTVRFAPSLNCQLLAEHILADPSVTLSIA